MGMGINYKSFISSGILISLGLSVVIQTFILCVGCFPWLKFIEIFSEKRIPFSAAMTVYTKANIYKYIPGNVFQYVGRNKLASDMEISHVDVACSTVLDIICGVISLGVISVIMLGDTVFRIIQEYRTTTLIVLFIGVLLLFLVFSALFILRKKFSNYLMRYKAIFLKKNRRKLLAAVAYYLIMSTLSAAVNFMAAYLIFDNLTSVKQLITIAGGYIFAWILGYITPGAPGGIGIRESVMLIICGGIFETSVMTYALVFRISSIFSDMLGLMIGVVYEKFSNRREENKKRA